jgi:6-phosphogluconolactonase
MTTREEGTLYIYETPAEVAKSLADLFVDYAGSAIGGAGRFVVALAGGTTPKATYALLAQPPYCNSIDWSAVEIFFGDERCVPPESDQSNYKMAFETFIKPLSIPDIHVHRMRGEDDPLRAALDYRAVLFNVLGEKPQFDLVLLGMGPDGHTASLFPGQDPLTEDEQRVRAVYATSQSQWRLTLTPSLLNSAQAVCFAVVGSEKAGTLAAVRGGPYNPSKHPAQIIAPPDGELIWLADNAAAARS